MSKIFQTRDDQVTIVQDSPGISPGVRSQCVKWSKPSRLLRKHLPLDNTESKSGVFLHLIIVWRGAAISCKNLKTSPASNLSACTAPMKGYARLILKPPFIIKRGLRDAQATRLLMPACAVSFIADGSPFACVPC